LNVRLIQGGGHARLYARHPRLFSLIFIQSDVDGRDKPGHDAFIDRRRVLRIAAAC
jgi:hypothetical protein